METTAASQLSQMRIFTLPIFFLTKGCENVTTLDANEVRQLEVYILIFHKKTKKKKDVCIFVYLIRGLRYFGDNKK